MNLADPELELIDPTPNVHSLFVHFDEEFFWTKLVGRALVRWSKRMYSSAGICSYEGRGGLCDIALSEPLLKLRPRKDLIETLLHEMIHAFLFITNRDNDRDGHGPNFQAHMHRINRAAGLNISIYHDFHDEVDLYLKHWWRCSGPCQKMRPHFGIVRRTSNRAPGPNDYWWGKHSQLCGGKFLKIKAPETPQKVKKIDKGKFNSDITKYINNNNSFIPDKNAIKSINKENKDFTNINIALSSNNNPAETKNLNKGRKRTNSASVIEAVRNVWINKQIPPLHGKTDTSMGSPRKPNLMNQRSNSVQVESPPKKMMKIDDYFKKNASTILKDVYGEEFMISQSNTGTKLKAVYVGQSIKVAPVNIFVDCPSCNTKVYSNDINTHLDECLNKDIIKKLTKDSIHEAPVAVAGAKTIDGRKSQDLGGLQQFSKVKLETKIKTEKDDKTSVKLIVGSIQTIPPFKSKTDNDTRDIKKENALETCLMCGDKINVPIELHRDKCLGFFDNDTTIPEEGVSNLETVVIDDDFSPINIKSEPGASKQTFTQKCPCCGKKTDKPIESHLDECLGFFDNNTTIPTEGANASGIETIVIDDDDDICDESQTLNATGTKSPCPCCLKMIEVADMNKHLDVCLSISM